MSVFLRRSGHHGAGFNLSQYKVKKFNICESVLLFLFSRFYPSMDFLIVCYTYKQTIFKSLDVVNYDLKGVTLRLKGVYLAPLSN